VSLHTDAVDALTHWYPSDVEQARLRQLYLTHLERHPDALQRTCHPDHLTASAIVISADRRRVLLNLHGRYRRWMQFGGHCESDDQTLAGAALRETAEESGIAGLSLAGGIAQLSRHEVRCGPLRPAHHLDVRFVAVAPADATAVPSAESLEVRWFDATEGETGGTGAGTRLPADLEPEVRELIARAVELRTR
jgi:8-oxo-dGTP pyrophosphatase MutT (NUDIX family)